MSDRSTFFHGGIAGLEPGQLVVPAPAHVEDGCPICEAKKLGLACSVGIYKRWLRTMGPRAIPILQKLNGVDDNELIDPPRKAIDGVYLTTSVEYATWYAARISGDLYLVKPVGDVRPSLEDHFQTVVAPEAVVVKVLRRAVKLTRTERRHLEHLWKKADARHLRQARAGA